MPVYSRETKTKGRVWDVVVADGRKRVWRRGLATKREAQAEERRLKTAQEQGIDINPARLTLVSYLEHWLTDYVAGLGETTRSTYASNLKTHVLPVLGEKLLRDLRPADVQSCYAEIMAKGRSRKLALNVHRVLREALSHAVKLELIGRNVCDAVQAPRASKSQVTPPTMEELSILLEAADQTQYGALVRVALWTGLRQGELLALKWDDVDLGTARLYVRHGKHDSAGAMVLSEETREVLRNQKIHQMEDRLKIGPAYKASGHVFTNQVGGRIDAGGLKRTWQRIKKTTRLATRFHDLRHAHASILIAAGVHAKAIQEDMRHRDIGTTLNTYGHLMPGLREEAARKIDEAMR